MKAASPNSTKTHVVKTFLNLRPMLPTISDIPSQPRHFAFELKYPDARTLCYHDGRQIYFRGTNGTEPAAKFPELFDLARFLGKQRTILDGHLVALDPSGHPDPRLLRQRLRTENPSFALVEKIPIRFIVSDILLDHGRWILNLPLKDRLRRLDRLKLNAPFWRTAMREIGKLRPILRIARQQKLPALIGKHLASPYEPGRKSPAWLQIPV
jgi:bifunctional non-homologous end joining protein LigD